MNPLYRRYGSDLTHDPDSTRQAAAPSGRKGSKKVRTGCITCKIRKVKCDETKPFCLRCTKTGRKCDGYLDPKALASRRRSKDQDPRPFPSFSLLVEWASPEEQRSFHFFQQVAAPMLSGDLDAFFWKVLVLQVCQTEPAVRHAVLAVSSLYEDMIQNPLDRFAGGSTLNSHSFALQQYNLAIACLLEQMKNSGSRPIGSLLTCVLFVCIEFMQSKDKESMIHLEQGRQILIQLEKQAESSQDPDIEAIKEHLVPIYTRLGLNSFLFGGTPAPLPPSLKLLKKIPAAFNSIFEARYTVYEFLDRILRFTQRSRPLRFKKRSSKEVLQGFKTEQDFLFRQLAKINVALSLFQASKARDATEADLATLQLYLHLVRIWLSTALSRRETDFDDHIDSFSAVVPLCSIVIDAAVAAQQRDSMPHRGPSSFAPSSTAHQADMSWTPGPQNPFMFTIEANTIAPLYYVATKCRHPLIRRAALDLLRKSPVRKENLWRADIVLPFAEYVVELEDRAMKEELGSQTQAVFVGGATPNVPPSPEPWGHHLSDLLMPDATVTNGVGYTIHAPAPTEPIPRPPIDGSLSTRSFAQAFQPRADDTGLDFTIGLGLSLEVPVDPAILIEAADSSQHSFGGATAFSSPALDASDPPPALVDTATSSTSSFLGVPATAVSRRQHLLTAETLARMQVHQHQNRQQQSSSSPPGSYSAGGSSSPGQRSSHHQRQQQAVRSPEAPFGLPEHLRVHDVILGPEDDGGSWITAFRKLKGLEGDWDVRTEYVRAPALGSRAV